MAGQVTDSVGLSDSVGKVVVKPFSVSNLNTKARSTLVSERTEMGISHTIFRSTSPFMTTIKVTMNSFSYSESSPKSGSLYST